MAMYCSTVEIAGKDNASCLQQVPVFNKACWQLQELVKVGCDVRYLNDSYRLNGLKATATQQVGLTSTNASSQSFTRPQAM